MKKRTNIVLTSDRNYKVKDAIVVHTVEELLQTLKAYKQEDIYVIGGESVYRQLLPYCDTAHITKIDHVYEADTYFPNLDTDEEREKIKNKIGCRGWHRSKSVKICGSLFVQEKGV